MGHSYGLDLFGAFGLSWAPRCRFPSQVEQVRGIRGSQPVPESKDPSKRRGRESHVETTELQGY